MNQKITAMFVVALLALTVAPGATAENEAVEEAKCEADVIKGLVPSGGGGVVRSLGLLPQVEEYDDPAFPQKEVCPTVEGSCTVTEDVGSSLSGEYWSLGFYGRAEIDARVSTYTMIDCTGVAKVSVLHFGGTGIRGVATRLGVVEGSGSQSLDLGQVGEYGRSEDTCEYVAQVERCKTTHSMKWQYHQVFKGALVRAPEGIALCSPLDIFNSDTVAAIRPLETLDVLPSDTHEWNLEICEFVEVGDGNVL